MHFCKKNYSLLEKNKRMKEFVQLETINIARKQKIDFYIILSLEKFVKIFFITSDHIYLSKFYHLLLKSYFE